MTTVAALRFPFASQNTGRSKYACTFLTVMIAIGWTAGPALPAYAAATPAIINITSRALTAIPAGFSGFNAAQPLNGVEYFDPKFVTATKALNPGWLRFPAGTASMAFDWNAGHVNQTWLQSLTTGSAPPVGPQVASMLTTAQQLTQAKGGVLFSDFITFAKNFQANATICFNGFTDTNPGSATQMAIAGQTGQLPVLEWELSNEPYLFPLIFPTAGAYADAMYPYFGNVLAGTPSATVGLSYAGQYDGSGVDHTAWDTGLQNYTNRYWKAATLHVYPITSTLAANATVLQLNGILAHASSDYINSYLVPKIGTSTPIFITEMNCCSIPKNNPFLTYLYNGIFLAEYTARLSAVPSVKAVGINQLYSENNDNHGMIQSMNDFESYLLSQLAADPNYSTNTATDPNTQFVFYTSAPGLAMAVANQAINSGTQIWQTTVTGGRAVTISGFDGNPIPALYAQAYRGKNGRPYLLITNKSAYAQGITIQVDGVRVNAPLSMTYVSSSNAAAANTAQAPNTVQIVTANPANPFNLGPYSVATVTW